MSRVEIIYKCLVSCLDGLNTKDVYIKITPLKERFAVILLKRQILSLPNEPSIMEIDFDATRETINALVTTDNFDSDTQAQLKELNENGIFKSNYIETDEDLIALRDKLCLLINVFLVAKPKEGNGDMTHTDKQDNYCKSNEEKIDALYKDLRDLVLDNASNFLEETITRECTTLSFDTLQGHTEIDYFEYHGQASLDINIVSSGWELYVNSQSSGATINKLGELAKSKLSRWLNDGLLEEEKQDESGKSEDGLKEYIKEKAKKEQDYLKEWAKNFNPYDGW